VAPFLCETGVLLNNNYIIIACGPEVCSVLRLGCAREYGSVFDDQKIVSDHEKCAIFVIAPAKHMQTIDKLHTNNAHNARL